MKFGVDYAHNTGNQHYRRRKWNSVIKSFVEEEMPCKTQVINDAQGQAPPQRTSQRFVTLLKALVGLLLLKFIRSLVSAMGACSPSSQTSCSFEKFRPDGHPGCWVIKISPNRRKIGSVVLDCPTAPVVQPGPLPLRLPHVWTPQGGAREVALRRWWAGREFRAQLATDGSSFLLRRRIKKTSNPLKKCIEKGRIYV